MIDKPGRTIELWLLALGLLGISLSGWLRLQFVSSAWSFVQQTGFVPGPFYQALMGAAWGLGGLVCGAGLLLRQRWAPAVTRITVLVLAGWYWADALLLTRSPDAAVNWPYMLGVTLFGVIFTFLTLALDRQKRFFRCS